MEMIFYTRPGCHLCEEAKTVIDMVQNEYKQLQLTVKNIEHSDELTERYGLMIPVIEIDNVMVQYGQIDYFTLSEYLQKVS